MNLYITDQTDLMGEMSSSSVLMSACKQSSCITYEMECVKELLSSLGFEVLIVLTMPSTVTCSDVMKCSLVKVFLLQWLRFDLRSYGMCGGQSGTGQVFPANSYSTNHSIFINRPIINSI